MNEEAVRNSKQARIQFIREYELPIDLVDEPYFSQRLVTMDCIYGCKKKWDMFVSDVTQYPSVYRYISDYDECISYVNDHLMFASESTPDLYDIELIPDEILPDEMLETTDSFPPGVTGKMCLEFCLKDDGYALLHNLFPGALPEKTFADYIRGIVNRERWKHCPDFRRKAMAGFGRKLVQLRATVFSIINERIGGLSLTFLMYEGNSLVYDLSTCLSIDDLEEKLMQLPEALRNAVEYDFFIPQELGENAKFGYLLDYFRDGKVEFRNLDERFANQIVLYLKHDYIMKSDLKFNFEDHLAEFKRKIDNPITYYPSRFANYHAVS